MLLLIIRYQARDICLLLFDLCLIFTYEVQPQHQASALYDRSVFHKKADEWWSRFSIASEPHYSFPSPTDSKAGKRITL